jgi:phosphatidylinositol-3-phosphatase
MASSATPIGHAAPGVVPTPAHVVVVMEENHSYDDIIGSASAPYLNSLARQGALFTSSFAVQHPSQPNYLELFSGSNQGVNTDTCPQTFSTPNLASELIAAGYKFRGYSEALPSQGSLVCTAKGVNGSGSYVRKHAPWTNFSNIPASVGKPFSMFPTDFNKLPTVSFVIPALMDDMHNGTVQQGDTWLQTHMDAYAQWAKQNNSLLIVTWDEDDNSQSNQIPTIIVGQGVTAGLYGELINHYSVLRTIEAMYGLPGVGNSAGLAPILDIWN